MTVILFHLLTETFSAQHVVLDTLVRIENLAEMQRVGDRAFAIRTTAREWSDLLAARYRNERKVVTAIPGRCDHNGRSCFLHEGS